MRTVKRLSIEVTYTVEFAEIDIPDNVYEQLLQAVKNDDKIDPSMLNYPEASNWVADNIRERDCMEWSAEIEPFQE